MRIMMRTSEIKCPDLKILTPGHILTAAGEELETRVGYSASGHFKMAESEKMVLVFFSKQN